MPMSGYGINGLTLHNYGDNLIPLAFVTSRVAWLDIKNQCSTDSGLQERQFT